ncbi:hypothetical protein WA1_11405 [Scytonema hofmannii PCC 7110]|uniref:Uncharacterized protein n=1 Tax=Scytonema hofmannii PCC 7110 TaxID=128403 RepID=A0A139XFH2_9CYAN|nr:hypothetical protein WA1_11405 [Scytonema hofmannii PCC 7110]
MNFLEKCLRLGFQLSIQSSSSISNTIVCSCALAKTAQLQTENIGFQLYHKKIPLSANCTITGLFTKNLDKKLYYCYRITTQQ